VPLRLVPQFTPFSEANSDLSVLSHRHKRLRSRTYTYRPFQRGWKCTRRSGALFKNYHCPQIPYFAIAAPVHGIAVAQVQAAGFGGDGLITQNV